MKSQSDWIGAGKFSGNKKILWWQSMNKAVLVLTDNLLTATSNTEQAGRQAGRPVAVILRNSADNRGDGQP